MSQFFAPALLVTACIVTAPCLASPHSRHASGSAHAASSHFVRAHVESGHNKAGRLSSSRHTAHIAVVHHEAPPAMETSRATEIQAALIRAGYLAGEPSGVWDAESIVAMQKMQDANGWQTKFTPDSRALLKLGLGGGATPAMQAVSQPAPVAEAAVSASAAQ